MNMKNILFAFLLLPQVFFAQKHDYIWVSGDSNDPAITTHGGITIDFNQKPVNAYYNYRKMNMFVCNASICDTAGNLLFYTNGCDIAGADDEILENGDEINPGYPHQLHCHQYNDGYASGIQSALILPLPESDSIYYLFHKSYIITSNPVDVITDKLLYSKVEFSNNNGGGVAEKNTEIINSTLAFGELIAVRNANGKDWWLVTPKRNSNTFYILRFTKDGIVDTFQQTIGILPAPAGEGYGQIVFSPDGSKIYRTNPFSPIMVYTFDREAGVITQFDTISYDYGNQPIIGEIGCAVSPNGRYLYLGCRLFLYQLDLQAPDVSASQTVVAEWDGVTAPVATLFWQLQLAPDCKIYGLAGGDTRYFHVIHNPDEPGLACNVEQRGLPLPTPSGSSMPSFPNYRLGPVDNPGVPCTATVGTQAPPTPLPVFSVFPNPVSAALKIVPNRQFGGQARVRLFDVTGRMALEEIFDPQSACTELDVRALPDGMYFYEIWSEGRVARAGKVFKVE
jgi:hypothetical protein